MSSKLFAFFLKKKQLFIRCKKLIPQTRYHTIWKNKKKKQLVIDEFVIHKGKAKRWTHFGHFNISSFDTSQYFQYFDFFFQNKNQKCIPLLAPFWYSWLARHSFYWPFLWQRDFPCMYRRSYTVVCCPFHNARLRTHYSMLSWYC